MKNKYFLMRSVDGEEFVVMAENIYEAHEMADEYCGLHQFICEFSELETDIWRLTSCNEDFEWRTEISKRSIK